VNGASPADEAALTVIVADPSAVLAPGPRPAAITFPGAEVTIDGGGSADTPPTVRLARDLVAEVDLYVAGIGTPHLVVSDAFRGALAHPAAREVGPGSDALLDCLLFRTFPGVTSPLPGVRQVGHGESLTLVRHAGVWQVSAETTHRGYAAGTASPDDAWVDQVEAALDDAVRAALAAGPTRAGVARTLFSGGVDSTLLQSFVGPGTPAVMVGASSPEHRPEQDYARHAAGLLGLDLRSLSVDEREYADRLESTVDALALPPHHLQTVLLDAAFRDAPATYVTGQFADALFGLPSTGHAALVWRLRWAAPLVAAVGAGPAGRPPFRNARTMRRSLAALQRPWTDPASWAHRFAVYGDREALGRQLGPAPVAARLRARMAYAASRHATPPRDDATGLAAHLEMGHLVDLLTDDAVRLWRQLAFARGSGFRAPFLTPGVVTAALAVPSPDRFVHGGAVKHALKRLLRRRVPAYPVEQPKLASGLPRERYLASGGVLAPLLHDYPVAAAWSELGGRGPVDALPADVQWNLLTYVLWQERVLRRPPAALPDGWQVMHWPEASASAAGARAAAVSD